MLKRFDVLFFYLSLHQQIINNNMKPQIKISKTESQSLLSAMLKNLPCQIFIIDNGDDTILMCIEFKMGENTLITANASLSILDWVHFMEEIKPSDTVGDEAVTIEWDMMDTNQLITEMQSYTDELLSKVESFYLEIFEFEP